MKSYKNIENIGEKTVDFILNVIFPLRCPYCDKVVPFSQRVCPECMPKFVYIKEPRCFRCGKSLSDAEKEICRDCGRVKHYFKQGRALYDYRSVCASMYRFKYAGRQEYGTYFGREMAKHLGPVISGWNVEAIVPVPIHFVRRHERGYNQAEVLAKELGRQLSLPVDNRLLKRIKRTVPQKFLDHRERQNNLKKAFKLGRNDVKWKSVIIVDDIYTTGSTIDACASVLLETGVEQVFFVAVAIGKEQEISIQ